jgi:hypothetical protein
MNDQNKPLVGELALRDALSRVADQYGKAEALRIVEEWTRTKLESSHV